MTVNENNNKNYNNNNNNNNTVCVIKNRLSYRSVPDSSDSFYSPLVGFFKNGKESSVFIKGRFSFCPLEGQSISQRKICCFGLVLRDIGLLQETEC
jgi:hypothetical protein